MARVNVPIINGLTTEFGPFGARTSEGVCPLTTFMNCDNYSEPYSFHPAGVNILMGDGSIAFLNENTSVDAWVSLLTAAADDIVTY